MLAKNLYDLLRGGRPNDQLPKVVLNMVGVPKRPEIPVAEFATALGTQLAAVISFEAQLFGTAANNGQMIAEVQPSGKAADVFADLAGAVTGRAEQKSGRGRFLEPILARLSRRKAS